MKKSMLFVVGLAVMLVANTVLAGQVLYVDAAAPGTDPDNTWADLSASNYGFANIGAVYNAVNKSYVFDGNGYLQGTGDESIYDFDVSTGTGADPFTIVAYFKVTAPWDGYWPTLISKQADASLSRRGWQLTTRSQVGLSSATQVVASLTRGTGDQAYFRATSQFDHSVWQMLMMTVDGSGDVWGIHVYANGSATPMTPDYTQNNIDKSILTDEPLRIGRSLYAEASFPLFYVGEIGFIEIWDEELPVSYGTSRWNDGDPQRGMVASLPGDANRDYVVNEDDAAILAANWLSSDADWGMGDFNDDGLVDDKDATMMAANWLKSQAAATVPEPSLAVLLGAALAMLMLAPRRRTV